MTKSRVFGNREEVSVDPIMPEAKGNAETKLPGIVMAAGIIWIIVGSLILLGTLVIAILIPMVTNNADLAGLLGVSVCLGLFGGAFIFVGVQTVRGTAVDTLGNGVGSIIFGILFGGANLSLEGGGGGLGLIVAGILALVGRAEYRAWRAARKARNRTPAT